MPSKDRMLDARFWRDRCKAAERQLDAVIAERDKVCRELEVYKDLYAAEIVNKAVRGE